MLKTISLTWPWNWTGTRWSFERTVQEVVALQPDRVAIRAFDGPYEYGTSLQTRLVWRTKTYRDLKPVLKALPSPIGVDLWGPIYLALWQQEATLQRNWLWPLYNQTDLFLDAEGKRLAQNIKNLGPFLRRLGRMPCRVWLQSYRYAQGQPWMNWQKWYTTRAISGEYVIDGLGHQLYPIGYTDPHKYLDQTIRDVQSHQIEVEKAGRPDMPWFPTLPAFIAGGYEGAPGWEPPLIGTVLVVEWLQKFLGSRLVGINWWSQDKSLYRLPGLASYIANLEV